MFGLGLSQEAMTFSHRIAFRKLLDFVTAKLKKEAYVAHGLWVAKRDELLQFFVSQLVSKPLNDEENAKQFIRKFADSIEKTLSEQTRTFIKTKLNERESEFRRLHFQEKREASMESMSCEDLLEYIIDPTKFIMKDFLVIWADFENSIRQQLITNKSEHLKLFAELKIILTRMNDKMASLKSGPETFNAQKLFQTVKLLPDSEEQINKSVFLKVCNVIIDLFIRLLLNLRELIFLCSQGTMC